MTGPNRVRKSDIKVVKRRVAQKIESDIKVVKWATASRAGTQQTARRQTRPLASRSRKELLSRKEVPH